MRVQDLLQQALDEVYLWAPEEVNILQCINQSTSTLGKFLVAGHGICGVL